jgi:hypothetical protein
MRLNPVWWQARRDLDLVYSVQVSSKHGVLFFFHISIAIRFDTLTTFLFLHSILSFLEN